MEVKEGTDPDTPDKNKTHSPSSSQPNLDAQTLYSCC